MGDPGQTGAGRRGPCAALRRWTRLAATAGLGFCALAPFFSGWGWVPDLLANTAAQAAAAGAVAAAAWLARRRTRAWGAGCAALALACAAWVFVPRRAEFSPAPAGGSVRFLVFNANPARTDPDAALRLVGEHGAGVAVFTEAPVRVARALDAGTLGAEFPGVLLRRPRRGDRPWQAAVSRWPLSLVEGPEEADALCFRVERPAGPLIVVAVHPPSPRSAGEWAEGNRRVAAAAAFAQRLSAAGETVVVAADLNAAPTGHRSRVLAAAGFRRAKPARAAAGTYPAGWPWPLGVAIDDLCVPRGVAVRAWRTAPGAGSDHRAVVVDVGVGAGSAAGR